ncbi:MAG: phytanoyl-CoA dioxygenase family protein [Streptomyces sp.]|uniref:phytanoyl-CoA dioxygenase family protein n=1 Tax=Streptomyces sp. TaxID=1931 RepID=UPI0025FD42A4|nr:phytanoyl-CoA dioxygenase family protein [Streptomyces sp.]MBW8801458.1 phytanoyl-CoA dioxygenase family protein [Streptomyces sp.]
MQATLDTDGYTVLRQAVAPERLRAALRMLNLAIRRYGLTAEEIAECQAATFFPHLRWEPEVWGVLPPAAGEVLGMADGDEWAEPQLLLRFPDEDQPWPLQSHIDEAPPWAEGRRYKGIVGVALTPAGPEDGTPFVWAGSHRGPVDTAPQPVPLEAGDAIVMDPALEHSGSLNLGPSTRFAIYFRLLTPA